MQYLNLIKITLYHNQYQYLVKKYIFMVSYGKYGKLLLINRLPFGVMGTLDKLLVNLLLLLEISNKIYVIFQLSKTY